MTRVWPPLLLLFTFSYEGKSQEKNEPISVPEPWLETIADRLVWSLGLGLNVPDIIPLEGMVRYDGLFAFRGFFVPSLPFDVKVEYSRGVLANQDGLAIENPDLTIDFDGVYGPQWGLEFLIFPFQESLYIGFGWSRRALSLEGRIDSNLILSSSAGSINTNSVISIEARARVVQTVNRISLGWKVPIGSIYLSFNLGYTFPEGGQSQLEMKGNIANPSAIEDISNQTIEEAERTFEADLEDQTRDDVDKVKDFEAPILGISIGMYI
ncbi:hypothetical protein [Pseudobacteriovorax antillogorgiicola]|uniref:Outer membrane protein beta-barrel domain-containing protein n=1 Tax=Pseudobacteriovorax antillogorgiicola TaxID=1513793 RepID=A0A1Y6CGV1_9BACT|nr:hypothetical protein [Pseudobacteriovorax antillogorgiicola]TCS48692.1 hypothetical protein EDD56_117114 [Pseudobacteriovorax antillogorgiicola]SMF54782.1 hypothetical protein SAMN06296036_11745 [Pseudobacteriovorax antillogorgiicola]